MIGRMNVVVSAGPCWHCWLGRLALVLLADFVAGLTSGIRLEISFMIRDLP